MRSTVTRRAPIPTAELVDAAERIKQSEHHQAANAAATATQAEPAVSLSIGPIRTRYKANSWPETWESNSLYF